MRLPDGLLEEIIQSRAYARAKATVAANPKASGGLIDEAKVIEYELAHEVVYGV